MSGKGIYQGYALQQVDEKGRVAIPSSLRSTLIARAPAGLDPKEAWNVVIGFHAVDPCLVGYDVERAERLHEELRARAFDRPLDNGAPDDSVLRAGLAGETMPFDASGRFIMPLFPRRRVGITRYAFFWGMGDYFEIWDPARLVATEHAAPVMRDAARFLMEERGETL